MYFHSGIMPTNKVTTRISERNLLNTFAFFVINFFMIFSPKFLQFSPFLFYLLNTCEAVSIFVHTYHNCLLYNRHLVYSHIVYFVKYTQKRNLLFVKSRFLFIKTTIICSFTFFIPRDIPLPV